MIAPVYLGSNQPPDRFYRGGEKIRALRGTAAPGDRVPEDWIASTTTLFGEPETGLSRLPDGRRLVDAVTADPGAWLGPEHVAVWGADTKLLVKLLDAGQRLPVHLHPARPFVQEYLERRHGKAEAWYILDGGEVHLGFKRDVDRAELDAWVAGQDVEAMLGAMHRLEVAPGDSVFVPPGLPHAIGAGVFIVEVQEPEDLSILLEWKGFAIDGEAEGHLGLGFGTALVAADLRGWPADGIRQLVIRQGLGAGTLADLSRKYFRAERLDVSGSTTLDAGFSVLVVVDGAGTLEPANAPASPLAKGDTLAVPFTAGSLAVTGQLSLVCCRPPLPSEGA
ncbi:class I mannose-6-phosphate isomerase [Arthrobacter sp. I2-34]|uniref:Class I mannose-6-phosphate isomerase n=1 Tax=Arthrobacter hankyongi TaxID=2904801 RepID=A0ABS9L742_9MICC|nr:class I mannose-6-phosphate isomerase [Arthrobacter hankyongi]MCG2622495.1 class I mannose-6-phosphate isomerase [Arthrobacter hankyongi]